MFLGETGEFRISGGMGVSLMLRLARSGKGSDWSLAGVGTCVGDPGTGSLSAACAG
jgi:hypothetical protein